MPDVLIYFIKVNLLFVVFFVFYRMVLARLTFFNWNRLFLLSSVLLALLIPAIPQTLFLEHSSSVGIVWQSKAIVDLVEPAWFSQNIPAGDDQTHSLIFIFLGGIYLLVVMERLFRFAATMQRILSLRNGYPSLRDGRYRVVHLDFETRPFSFFGTIFLGPSTTRLSAAELEYILAHERAHGQARHSADILLLEFLCALFWPNPVIYRIKKELQTLHEFYADHYVTRRERSNSYARLLLRMAMPAAVAYPVNGFNQNQLKERIVMLNRLKTNKRFRLVYLLILPVFMLTIMSFSQPTSGSPFSADGAGLQGRENRPYILPIARENIKALTSGYGMRMHPFLKKEAFHNGVDFAAPMGTPVRATAAGMVIKITETEGYGKLIILQHDARYTTRYAMLSGFNVQEGDAVEQGQTIGFVGSSGRSTAPHLHYEVYFDGQHVDPADYFIWEK